MHIILREFQVLSKTVPRTLSPHPKFSKKVLENVSKKQNLIKKNEQIRHGQPKSVENREKNRGFNDILIPNSGNSDAPHFRF